MADLIIENNIILKGSGREVIIPEGVTAIGPKAFYRRSSLSSIILPAGITTIEDEAFAHCSSLETIVLPGSVRHIGKKAFLNCNCLRSVVFQGSVELIDESAFESCIKLTSIILPDGLLSISSRMFFGCKRLEWVSIPSTVTDIHESAFAYCSMLETIVIPGNVSTIHDEAFLSCSSLKSISLSEGVHNLGRCVFAHCSSITQISIPDSLVTMGDSCFIFSSLPADSNGFVIIKDTLVSYTGISTSVTVPSGIKRIDARAFTNIRNLAEIIVSEGVTEMHPDCILGCSDLERLYLPDSLSSYYSNDDHYSYDQEPLSVYVNDLNTYLRCRFKNDHCLYVNGELFEELNVPVGITTIPENLFQNCSSLNRITLPETVTAIGKGAFSGSGVHYFCLMGHLDTPCEFTFAYGNDICVYVTNLKTYLNCTIFNTHSLYLNNKLVTDCVLPSSIEIIPDYAFFRCSSICHVSIPDSVTNIGNSSFGFCDSLKDIQIPRNVRSIGINSFTDCTRLESVSFLNPNTWIGKAAFFDCSSLVSIQFPSKISVIEAEAFFNCSSLTSLRIPRSVNEIRRAAFAGCSQLSSVAIPLSCYQISHDAFNGCSQLIDIDMLPDQFKYLTDTTQKNIICESAVTRFLTGGAEQSEHMKEILSSFLKKKSAWEKYILRYQEEPNLECLSALLHLRKKPLTINEIDTYLNASSDVPEVAAFWLEYKNSHYSADSIAENEMDRFEKELGVKEKTVAEWRQLFKFSFKNGEICISGYKGSDPNVVIPSSIGKYKVTSIADYAFQSCNIQTIVFPDGIRCLGEKLFAGCNYVDSITLPDGIQFLQYDILGIMQSVPKIIVPSLESYLHLGIRQPHELFLNGQLAETVCLPEGMTEVPAYAFHSCESIRYVQLPDSITKIGERAFENCTYLETINLPDGIHTIGPGAFAECYSLTTVHIPKHVKIIRPWTFYLCTYQSPMPLPMRRLYIPSSVKKIESYSVPAYDFLTLVTSKGSYAESFAKANNIAVEYE